MSRAAVAEATGVFGQVVTAHRKQRGLTQEALAAATGLSARRISELESGRVGRPRTSTVAMLADAFGLSGAGREQFLRQAYELDDPPAWPGPSWRAPRQLPTPAQLFTGRAMELADLGKVHDASTMVIAVVDGMAGVGKTALALQAAHQMVGRYPDGQLFVDLHSYTQGTVPVDPGQALDRMLRALGFSGARIPPGLEERAGLFRSRLADRRVLIVLDNAATEAQLMPLLPGAAGCLVLVTSRCRLVDLDHTYTLSLDTLPLVDAVTLFRRSVSERRLVGQPPDPVVELVELCGRLPLAIRIAAARLRSHPAWQPEHLVRRLRDRQHRLVELVAGQRSVTAALDLSYQDLGIDRQRMYRLLGLHPGPDIDPYAAAALFDATPVQAGRMLEQLLEAHLLDEPVPGRYRFHDLIRAHAADTAAREESEDARRMALDRLLNYYRHTSAVAMDTVYPYERDSRPQVPPADTPSPTLSDPPQALGWLNNELPNLLAAAMHATQYGRPAHLLHLSTILHRHLLARGPYHDAVTLHQQALTTARDTGDRTAEIGTLVGLGRIYRQQGQYEQATDNYQQALRLAHAAGDVAELDALVGLGHVHWQQGQYEWATDHYQQVLRLAHAAGHQAAELDALVGLGYVHWQQGRYELATDHYQQALQLAHAAGNQAAELCALVGLGHVHRQRGRYDQAIDRFQQALRLARAGGNQSLEQLALAGLGLVHRRLVQHEQAIDHLQQALQLARAAGNLNVEQIALTGLGHSYRMQGRYEQAAEQYRRLLDLALQNGDRNYQYEARQGLGRLQHATGQPDTALTHHEQALRLATELGQPDDQARAHDGLAHAHHTLHETEQAHAHWRQALDILTRLGVNHTDDEETTVVAIRAHLDDRKTAAPRRASRRTAAAVHRSRPTPRKR